MGLITKNIPQMYKIFVEIPFIILVFVKKLDEMQYKMIKNLTFKPHYLFPLNMIIIKSSMI